MRIIMLYFKCILWWFYRKLPGNKTNEKTPIVMTAGWTWVGKSGKKLLALKIWMRKGKRTEFPNGLVVKTLQSHCRGSGFDPCWGTKMLHDVGPSQKKKKKGGKQRKTLKSPLDSKEIKAVNPKGNQPWIFIGRTDAKAKAPILWPPQQEKQNTEWSQKSKNQCFQIILIIDV